MSDHHPDVCGLAWGMDTSKPQAEGDHLSALSYIGDLEDEIKRLKQALAVAQAGDR